MANPKYSGYSMGVGEEVYVTVTAYALEVHIIDRSP